MRCLFQVSECRSHYPLATFTALLGAKYCYSVPKMVCELLNYVFPPVMKAGNTSGRGRSEYIGK